MNGPEPESRAARLFDMIFTCRCRVGSGFAQQEGIMKRVGVLFSIVVVLLFGGLARQAVPVTLAQDATPAAESIPPLLLTWAEAWSSSDPAQVAALYAEDGVYEEIPTGVVAQGPEEIETFIADTFAAFSNVQVTPRTEFQAEEWAVMEADFSGESAEGTDFSIPFIVVFELDGDRIARNADYFDLRSLMAQLEPPAAEGTPAA